MLGFRCSSEDVMGGSYVDFVTSIEFQFEFDAGTFRELSNREVEAIRLNFGYSNEKKKFINKFIQLWKMFVVKFI